MRFLRGTGPGGGRALFALGAIMTIAACARIVPESIPPTVTPPPGVTPAPTTIPTPAPVVPPSTSALQAGITRGPGVGSLGLRGDDALTALSSFVESCPALLRRNDASGLTATDDWQASCAAATDWPKSRASLFFEQFFDTALVGDGKAFATGYFEPEILGSRTRRPGHVPVYGVPSDLTRGWTADTPQSECTGTPPRGRYNEAGEFVPYHDRTEIEEGALNGKAPIIAWAADPVEFFFLQIQGSGRIRTPSGEVIRIGYADQNGRGYTGIGGIMRERGLLGSGPGQYSGSMQGIMAYIRDNPEDGKALMRENKSWVFFRELTGDGPLGSIGVVVRRESSVAVDPRFVPYGAPVWLDLDRREANGLWIAQDTGGAIRGANRFDTFWGAGPDAREIAGGMTGRGQALILLPKGVVERHITSGP